MDDRAAADLLTTAIGGSAAAIKHDKAAAASAAAASGARGAGSGAPPTTAIAALTQQLSAPPQLGAGAGGGGGAGHASAAAVAVAVAVAAELVEQSSAQRIADAASSSKLSSLPRAEELARGLGAGGALSSLVVKVKQAADERTADTEAVQARPLAAPQLPFPSKSILVPGALTTWRPTGELRGSS